LTTSRIAATAAAASVGDAATAFNQKQDLRLSSRVWTKTALRYDVTRLRLEAVANQLCDVTTLTDVSFQPVVRRPLAPMPKLSIC